MQGAEVHALFRLTASNLIILGGAASALGALGALGKSLIIISQVRRLVVCQVYQAIEEEKLLGAAFPEYADYALKTARFIPWLF